MLMQDYWNLYQDKDYINECRNKNFSYSINRGGHYGYKSMWHYAKNNIPVDKRMKFMTLHLGQTEEEVKKRLYEIKNHYWLCSKYQYRKATHKNYKHKYGTKERYEGQLKNV